MLEMILGSKGKAPVVFPSDTWKRLSNTVQGARGMMAGVGDTLYVLDGWLGATNKMVWGKYPLSTDLWTNFGRSGGPPGLRSAGVASAGTYVYIFAGYNGSIRLNTLWRFDTLSQTWGVLATGPAARVSPAMTQTGGKLYIFGGDVQVGNDWMKDFWTYDITANTWSQLPSGPPGRYEATLTAIGTKIYLYGGRPWTGPRLTDLWCYDTENSTWTQLTSGAVAMTTPWMVSIGGKLYLSGGSDMWCYDPASDQWTQLAMNAVAPYSAPQVRYDHMMTVHDGQIYVCGGRNIPAGAYLDDLWRYSP